MLKNAVKEQMAELGFNKREYTLKVTLKPNVLR